MPKIISDSVGEEIEVFTTEELEQKQQEAIEEYKTENPDKTEEMENLQTKLQEAEEEVNKLKGKDTNFSNLRKQKEGAEQKVEALKKEIDEKIEQTKKDVVEKVNQDYYQDTLKELSGDDEELKKKIEFHYNRIQGETGSKQEISEKLRDAWVLSTKTETMDNSVFSSGGIKPINIQKEDNNFTDEEKQLARKLASAGGIQLKEEDFK